jgi:hypothetical protein
MFDHDRYRVLVAQGDGATPDGFERLQGAEAERVIEQAFGAPHTRERLLELYRRHAPHHGGHARFGRPDLGRARAWLLRMVQVERLGLLVLRRGVPGPGELPELPEPPSPPRPPGPPTRADWIEIELLDQDGEPFIGTPYSIAKGEDAVSAGGLNRFGSAYVDRIDPGSYRVVIGRSTSEEPLEPTDWVAFELAQENGLPIAGLRYVITDAAGADHEGALDAHGRALLFNVAPGECTVAFPDLAEE